jgi:hypothetical protein
MRLKGVGFPEALRLLADDLLLPIASTPRRKFSRPPAPKPSGMPIEAAVALVEQSERLLWSPEGSRALAYLTGPKRGLSEATIQAARLGWTRRADGVAWKPPGIVVPWFNGPTLALVKVRASERWRSRFPEKGRPPKYIEGYRGRVCCYPSVDVIRPGLPLVITEGEFDALLLGQELDGLASVITLGSASNRPDRSTLGRMLAATRWYLATDNDAAGDKAAEAWPAPVRRVRPPGQFKDWTEARTCRHPVNLRRWWGDVIAGREPELFTWEELSTWQC